MASRKRARVTQFMNLLHLAPEIQEAILFLPRTVKGRDPVRERQIRSITGILDWHRQRECWGRVAAKHTTNNRPTNQQPATNNQQKKSAFPIDGRCQKVFNGGAKGQEVGDSDNQVALQGRAGSLLGRFPHRLDPKRRITLPATLRNRMGNPTYVYVMPDLNRLECLNVFPPAEIESRLDKLRAAALTDRRASEFVTWVGSISETLDIDSQGRIRICDSLLARVGVKRDLVLIGAFNRIQVWSDTAAPAEHEAFDKFADAARELGF